jgi:hypothetical protein
MSLDRLKQIAGRKRLTAAAAAFAQGRGWHLARVAEYDLVRRDYYSPIPNLGALPADVWLRKSPMAGIDFDTASQIRWAEKTLSSAIAEFSAPAHGTYGAGAYYYENRSFEYGDAEIAYAIVRATRPRRILELGSGFSTLILAMACEANARDGADTELVANDPFPRGVTPIPTPGLTRLERRRAEDVPLEEFEKLEAGDVLFVDTTHTVKIGGDVNYVVLDVLPKLQPGVLVHFHDIFLPHEYPRPLVEGHGAYWAEQYLLQAFLALNAGYEVLFANHAVSVGEPEDFRQLVPAFRGDNVASGFWLRARDHGT